MVEMIIVMNPKCSEREVKAVENELTKQGFCGVIRSSFVALAVIRCSFGGNHLWLW